MSGLRCAALLVFALVAGCSANRGQETPFGFEHEVEHGMGEIQLAYSVVVANCMADAGHPEPMLAERLRPSFDPIAHSGMVHWHPLETGPTAVHEAETYGLLGVSLAFQRPLAGDIVGSTPDFDGALATCRESVDRAVGTPVNDTLDAWTADQSRIRRSFIERVEPMAAPLIEAQLACFGNAAGISDQTAAAGDFEAMLRELGIEPGVMTASVAPDVTPGTVGIHQRLPTTYSPTEQEVAVAHDFVDCATEMDLIERMLEIEAEPRRATLEEYDDMLSRYRDWIDVTKPELVLRRGAIESDDDV
ncbi:MAG: hypothetical protein AAGA93_13085 [Actinomycetota bacterium]